MDEQEWEHILQIKTAGHFQFNVGRTDKYVMGNGYDVFIGTAVPLIPILSAVMTFGALMYRITSARSGTFWPTTNMSVCPMVIRPSITMTVPTGGLLS